MLLNAWLSAARRQFLSASSRRVNRIGAPRVVRMESLEERTLLSGIPAVNTLVINPDNVLTYLNTSGGLEIDNADMAGKDGLVIEGVAISATTGDAISVNLSGIPLQRFAIESVTVSQYTAIGIDIDLTGVTGLDSIAIEDTVVTGTTRGLDLNLSNTDTNGLTVKGSTLAGVLITATGGADIRNGIVTQNRIAAPAGVEGVILNVQSVVGSVSTADGFRIEGNTQISSVNKDAVLVNATGALDGARNTVSQLNNLVIASNVIGSDEGADVSFVADGDTFVQPFVLTNNSRKGDLLNTFVFDLTSIGLEFDVDPITGKAFTPIGTSGATTGFQTATVSPDKKTLTVTFNDFNPGESLRFVIDVDIAGGTPASIFGNNLIGADVSFAFSNNKNVSGQMAGDPARVSASQFIIGANTVGANSGIHINANAMPLMNLSILGNTVTGVPAYSVHLDTKTFSDITGTISGNSLVSSGRDGLRMDLVDSNFFGSVTNNNIANNGSNGIAIRPNSSRSGIVQAATNPLAGAPIVITSANHNLQTGDRVMLYGLVNHSKTRPFLTESLYTVTRVANDRFSLQGTGVTDTGAIYEGGGAWYVPDFRNGGTSQNDARGFVQVDLQTNAASKPITGATNASDIVITSTAHGLKTGERVYISGVQGNTAANGIFTVTALTANTFMLKGTAGNGTYTIGGSFIPLNDSTPYGSIMEQGLFGNTISGNGLEGISSISVVGTTVRADLNDNVVTSNGSAGVHFESKSFGLGGVGLPLPITLPPTAPLDRDLGFSVNIGRKGNDRGDTGTGNTIVNNAGAGIALEALDYGTGSFEIWNNTIVGTKDDNTATTPYAGEGVFLQMDNDDFASDAISILSKSVIKQNIIGVDNQVNEGHGLYFQMSQRTTLQQLEIVENNFLNNRKDGFHFEGSEDVRLSGVRIEKNRSTNNGGDGFDLFVKNNSGLNAGLGFRQFFVNENFINDNAQYGMRVKAEANARVSVEFNNNEVLRNGHTPAGQGFHPNDGVPGSFQAAGGVGINVFQEIDIKFTSDGSRFENNFGDGFSIDAFNFFDRLKMDATFVNASFSGNTLTGFRNHGAAFGLFSFDRSSFDNNGEDGLRSVSIEDKTDFFERRVGGMDLDFKFLTSTFNSNTQNGAKLGQGVSAAFGDGTVAHANYFNLNGQDGLKIVQSAGPELMSRTAPITFNASGDTIHQSRRHIGVHVGYFQSNGGDGVDIGHFAQTEGGNVEQGDEVITDTNVSLTGVTINGNAGDGIEYLADSILRITPIIGGGQDVTYDHQSSLSVEDSFIVGNQGRGIDILNRVGEDSFINLINNQILSNRLEGVFVMNTASRVQLQTGPSDPLNAFIENVNSTDDSVEGFSVGTKQRQVVFQTSPHIELRVQRNLIESNGNAQVSSVVPVNLSQLGVADENGQNSTAWTHQFTNVQGTLGGLVVRVGAADSAGRFTNRVFDAARPGLYVSNPNWELGLAGVDAEIYQNTFDGNYGTDVYFDAFTSQIPLQTLGRFNPPTEGLAWDGQGYRDPLSRLDLVFRENVANSIDVTNGFAFLDNRESEFKSRSINSFPPNHTHENDPWGPWPDGGPYRFRNQQRTIGYFNSVGDDPNSLFTPYYWDVTSRGGVQYAYWSFDGWGTSTWRVESDFDTNRVTNTNPAQGYSGFYNTVAISVQGDDTQWDTGTNQPGFVGDTDWSLRRGDLFNVGAGLAPIEADSLEENDSFVQATELGIVSGSGFSVNSRAVNNVLSVHTKADRDYYAFTAGGAGALTINLQATDSAGDQLAYMMYEIDSSQDVEEVAVLKAANGVPLWVIANPGAAVTTLTATVKAGTRYVIEVFGTERENVFQNVLEAEGTDGNPGFYGTSRTYTITIDAPAAAPGSGGTGGSSSSGNTGGTGTGSSASNGAGNGSGGGATGANGGSVSGPPVVLSVGPVSPDPRAVSAGSVIVDFNEDVTGVDLADFKLTRDAVTVNLTTGGATVTQLTPMRYRINLGNVTAEAGTYVLTVVAAGSGIRDTDFVALAADRSDTWIVDNTVTSLVDSPDTNPGDGSAVDINGLKTLRAAVMESNASPGADVITLGAGTYTLSRTGAFEDAALTGDLDISGVVTIRGVSAAATVIDAGMIDRIFHVHPGATLTLENLTIKNGFAFDGAGVYVATQTTPTLLRGTLNLRNVNVICNEATNQGGGIFNAGVLNVVGSSISENIAGSRGGGVNNTGTASYLNTTVSTNYAASRGGGLFNENNAGSTVLNVTIVGNDSGSRGGGTAAEAAATTQIGNSILERNTNDVPTAAKQALNMFGGVFSRGFNALQVIDTSYATGAAAGLLTTDRFGRLSPLSDLTNILQYGLGNGVGFHALKPNGLAVDGGSNAVYPTTPIVGQKDAIGNPRLIEGNGDTVLSIDQGAVEYLVDTPFANFVATPNPAGLGEVITFNGLGSTHPNPAVGSIAKWEWDFDYNPTNQAPVTNAATEFFTKDAEGSTVTRSYNDASRTSYTVRLIVTDNFGKVGFVDQVVRVGAPSKPVVARPFAVTTDLTPEIRWTATPATYTLQLYNVTSGSRVLDRTVNNLTSTSYTPPSNLSVGRYEVVVTATNGSGSNVGDSYFFEVRPLTLNNPQNLTFDVTPKFTWNAIPGASRYDIWVTQTAPRYVQTVLRNQFVTSSSFEVTTSLGLGSFNWWVRAYDADGTFGAWSAPNSFSIGKPSFTAPAVSTLDTTPTFTWTDMGAARYELWVNQVGGTNKIIYRPALTTNTFTPTTALPNGNYQAWVRPLAADGEAGLWSDVYNFRMDYRVGPVTTAPVGILTTSQPTFKWNAIDSVAKYDLWVTNLTSNVRQFIRTDVTVTGQKQLLPASVITTGRVITYEDLSLTLATANISTVPATQASLLQTALRAKGGALANVTVTYLSSTQDYQVEFPTSTTSALKYVSGGVTVPAQIAFYIHSTALPAGDYRWWVQAVSTTGTRTAWSAPKDFTIAVPTIIAPNGSINTNLPLFTWNAVPGFVKFDLWVNNLTTNTAQVLRVQDLTTKSYQAVLPLENGTFRTWVRGFDAAGNVSQWSAPVDFTISVGVGNAAVALTPSGSTSRNSPTFTWSAGSNPTPVRYEILLKRIDLAAQPTVLNVKNLQGLTYTASSLTLTPGAQYRWWVRGLDVAGNGYPWSQPRNFTVTDFDAPEGTQDGPMILEAAEPMLVSLPQEQWTNDGVLSISAHPAATVIQVDPVVFNTPEVQTVSAPLQAIEPMRAEFELSVDELMAELAGDFSLLHASRRKWSR